MTATLEAGPVTLERGPHTPVLLDRIVELLAVPPRLATIEGVLVDATVGAGGHAAALLEASAAGVTLVGLDRDPDALTLAAERLAPFGERVTLLHARFDALVEHLTPILRARPVLGVLYDLGVSSMQVDRAERGFSFRADAPLDMRMDPTQGPTAADLVNHAEPAELARLIATYGEERHARRIARAIVRARPLATTTDLADVVRDAVPFRARNRRAGATIHPATRTFQALRIAVNAELDAFRASLPQALELAPPAAIPSGSRPEEDRGGRVAVLAYHSLEDRIAKQAFADAARGCVCPPDLPVCGCGRNPTVRLLTRGAETPGPDEVARNSRARSARLRAVEAVGPRFDRAPESPDAAER